MAHILRPSAMLCQRLQAHLVPHRQFHGSRSAFAVRRTTIDAPEDIEAAWGKDMADFGTFVEGEEEDEGTFYPRELDTTNVGHAVWQLQRERLYYMRLIEHEMPKLVAFRKPFKPPTRATPLVVRSLDYGGEEHPATVKRSVVVPVAHLPLRDEDAVHKLKILAGVRWTPDPPKNGGVQVNDEIHKHGYVHISCEDFPEPAMNLKWAGDALDRLIAEANDPEDKFKNVPLDTRHIDAKRRKAKKGDHALTRPHRQPSIRDFPKEWLPPSTSLTSSAA